MNSTKIFRQRTLVLNTSILIWHSVPFLPSAQPISLILDFMKIYGEFLIFYTLDLPLKARKGARIGLRRGWYRNPPPLLQLFLKRYKLNTRQAIHRVNLNPNFRKSKATTKTSNTRDCNDIPEKKHKLAHIKIIIWFPIN